MSTVKYLPTIFQYINRVYMVREDQGKLSFSLGPGKVREIFNGQGKNSTLAL